MSDKTTPTAMNAASPSDFPDECAATGQTCAYGPYGRNGERQCKWCAAPVGQGNATSGEALPSLPQPFGSIDVHHDDARVTSVDGFTAEQMRGYAIDYGFQLGRAALAAKAEQSNSTADAPYRVAEFWSSSNPGTKVRMLAEGRDIEQWGKRGDFIRWVDAPVAERAAAPASVPDGDALSEMEVRKDAAYLERNQVVAALAKCFPSGVARTAIEGWSEDWYGCVYIDLPTGQVSWHFHDSQAHLFDGIPAYAGTWDGHDTPEKYRRLAALAAPEVAQPATPGELPPLPPRDGDWAGDDWFTADTLRKYGQECAK